ncbi:MAG: hypothetical protein QW303_05975 [Nitrososphaerota archaeon]
MKPNRYRTTGSPNARNFDIKFSRNDGAEWHPQKYPKRKNNTPTNIPSLESNRYQTTGSLNAQNFEDKSFRNNDIQQCQQNGREFTNLLTNSYELYYKKVLKDKCSFLCGGFDAVEFLERIGKEYHKVGLAERSLFELPSDKSKITEAEILLDSLKKKDGINTFTDPLKEEEMKKNIYKYNDLYPFWIFVRKDWKLKNCGWNNVNVGKELYFAAKELREVKIIVRETAENIQRGVYSIGPNFKEGFIPLLLEEFFGKNLPRSSVIIYFHKIAVRTDDTYCEGYKVHVIFKNPNEIASFLKYLKCDFINRSAKHKLLDNYKVYPMEHFPILLSIEVPMTDNIYIYKNKLSNKDEVWEEIEDTIGIPAFTMAVKEDKSKRLIYRKEYNSIFITNHSKEVEETTKILYSQKFLSEDEKIRLIAKYEYYFSHWSLSKKGELPTMIYGKDYGTFVVKISLKDTEDEYCPIDEKFSAPHYIPMVVNAFIKGYLPSSVHTISFIKTLIPDTKDEKKYVEGFSLYLLVDDQVQEGPENAEFCKKYMQEDFIQLCKAIRPKEAEIIDLMAKCVVSIEIV